MYEYLLTLHVTGMALVVGTLFLQSLAIVMAQRLKGAGHQEGVRELQRRIHLFIYYPILAVTLLTGLWLALDGEVFSQGKWLQWKLVLVILLIGLGFLVGWELRSQRVPKPIAMLIHIVIFLLAAAIVYLATVRPF
ncbi:MAG TPA: CopD family protein [bacterium]